jgi:hypothetical protein
MSTLLLNPEEQGLVVFKIWPNMDYRKRLITALCAIAFGLAVQAMLFMLFPGILFVLAGNLLLVVTGYNNLVNDKAYSAVPVWQKAGKEKLRELKNMDRRIQKWDRSAVDATNLRGGLIFLLLLCVSGGSFLIGLEAETLWPQLFGANLGVLFLPHWVTGVRRILTKPNLMIKVEALLKLLDRSVEEQIEPDKCDFMLLLREGEKAAMPEDVKMRIIPKDAHPSFLGLQVQVSLNQVQGNSYVYLYVVAIAKPGYGLKQYSSQWTGPDKTVQEYRNQEDVEVLVIRQKTSKNSGYHTREQMIKKIFLGGLEFARTAAKGPFQKE